MKTFGRFAITKIDIYLLLRIPRSAFQRFSFQRLLSGSQLSTIDHQLVLLVTHHRSLACQAVALAKAGHFLGSTKPSRRLTLPLAHRFCSCFWFAAERRDCLDRFTKPHGLTLPLVRQECSHNMDCRKAAAFRRKVRAPRTAISARPRAASLRSTRIPPARAFFWGREFQAIWIDFSRRI